MYRALTRRIINRFFERPLVIILKKLGISPNIITIIGLGTTLFSAYLISAGYFMIGGIVLIISSVFDLLDGALARSMGKATVFGGVLDSISDRIGEIAIFCGLLIFYIAEPMRLEIILLFLALAGSLLVSYIRARAQAALIDCEIGIMTRPERLILISLGLIINQMSVILWIIVALTIVTAGQRILHTWLGLSGKENKLTK